MANVVDFNSILSAFVVDRCLSRLDKNLQHDKSQLLSDCKEARRNVESERKEAAKELKKVKGKKMFTPFLLYLFLSQLYAIPVGMFVILPPGILIAKYNILIGAPIGLPPGVFILETIAFISSILIVLVPTIGPRLKWEKIHTGLQHREDKLDKTVKMIEKESLN